MRLPRRIWPEDEGLAIASPRIKRKLTLFLRRGRWLKV
jgi:hypothetical protein